MIGHKMETQYQTIQVKESNQGFNIIINRPKQRNSLNNTLLEEIGSVLDVAEKKKNCPMIILEGQPEVFCTGQDLEEVTQITSLDNLASDKYPEPNNPGESIDLSNPYMNMLKRFTTIPKIIVSSIDGQVMAGGVGIAAASDLVIATPRTRFSLSEALWGLLPAMVTPFLIRRTGFQTAYRMALTTIPLSALEAKEINLVDEISEMPEQNIHRLWLRISKLNENTIGNIKKFFRKMWFLDEKMEKKAVAETLQRYSDPEIIENISNYVKYKKFPWDK